MEFWLKSLFKEWTSKQSSQFEKKYLDFESVESMVPDCTPWKGFYNITKRNNRVTKKVRELKFT